MTTCALRDIFRVNLGVKKHEALLLFTDIISDRERLPEADEDRRTKLRCLAVLLSEIAKSYCDSVIYHEYAATGSHGAEPPAQLWELAFGTRIVKRLVKERLFQPILQKTAEAEVIRKAEEIIRTYKDDAVDCIVALSNYSTSHTKFRDFLTRLCGCRYASMPLFEVSMLEGSMNIDWKELAERTTELANLVNKAEAVSIRTPNGTSISFSKKGRKALADTGILTRKGSFGNLPAGEVFFAPVEGTANGRLVVEWGPTKRLSEPMVFTVKDGIAVDVSGGDDYVSYLKERLDERQENRNIAELGIGTNLAAKRPDNILESEKILGTIHIALGDNSSFGGRVKAPFHQDFVFFRPTVTLIYGDGSKRAILKGGKIQI